MSFKFRGFTLIELLVVIAIIGILATVVIGSISTARSKGKATSAVSTAAGLRSQAELFYDSAGGVYTGLCADTNFVALSNKASVSAGGTAAALGTAALGSSTAVGTVYCNAAATTYVHAIVVSTTATDTNNIYCVDSAGTAKKTGAVPAASTLCP